MTTRFPKIYSSFADFEREELRRLDSFTTSVEDMLDERFSEELDFQTEETPRRRRRR